METNGKKQFLAYFFSLSTIHELLNGLTSHKFTDFEPF